MSDQLVAVTGASGFIGSHIVKLLLERGSNVRAIILRNTLDEQNLTSVFSEQVQSGQLTFVYIDNITETGTFDQAFQGATGLIHLASPVPVGDTPESLKSDIIDPAVKGAQQAVQSATKAGTIKKIVLTSSIAALYHPGKIGHTFTSADWNPITEEEAIGSGSAFLAYCAGKKLAEKEAWNFQVSQKPGWSLTTLQPGFVFGPPLFGSAKSGTNSLLWGSLTSPDFLYKQPIDAVHIQDVAQAHVEALLRPETDGKRYLISNRPVPHSEIAEMAGQVPELAAIAAQKINPDTIALQDHSKLDGRPALTELGLDTYTPVEEAISAVFRQGAKEPA